MRKIFNSILSGIAKNELLWKVSKPFVAFGLTLEKIRTTYLNEEDKKHKKSLSENSRRVCESLESSLVVLNGPFKGLKYSSDNSFGSAFYPKLLGVYEKELHVVFNQIQNNNYSEIIDVGCAEGYYAVGLAKVYPDATIHAYDISKEAQNLCTEMATINNVSSQVKVKGLFSSDELGNFNFTGKGLILSDCEGFEKELFNESNLANIKNCDLIIEVHDFIDIDTSTHLKKLLANTHQIKSIYSVDDIHKSMEYNIPELDGLSLKERFIILNEGRPSIMEWLICTPKAMS